MRTIQQDDVDIIFDLRSNPEVQKFIDRDPYSRIEEAQVQVKKVMRLMQSCESLVWIILLEATDTKIGSICLWNFNEDRTTAEVGYDLLPAYHCHGYMTEALQLVMDYAQRALNVECLEAFTSQFNTASKALLLKNGFVLDKDRKDEGFPDNRVYLNRF